MGCLVIRTSARLTGLKVRRGGDRVIVQFARVRQGTDFSASPQDNNFYQEEMDARLNMSGMTDGRGIP
jgi:hypothetical protein